MHPKRSFRSHRVLTGLFFACLFALPATLFAPPIPAWWSARGAVVGTAQDDAVATVGQLKHIAAKAYEELEQTSVFSANAEVAAQLVSWRTPAEQLVPPPGPRNDLAALRLGQLKYVGKLFYDQLILDGFATTYPWTGGAANDTALAALGQVKRVFSFDVGKDSDSDGMPDWWETKYGLNPNSAADASIVGNDGLTHLEQFKRRRNPTVNAVADSGSLVDLQIFTPLR